ncbi:MAG: CHC2 zinc finger domain-containing protein, partial [Chitinophagaceae bacterium]
MSTGFLSCREAKEKDLVNYLSSLGFQPEKVIHDDYWYLSLLREEKTASFKVNRKKNIWYDFGTADGGTIIDFGIRFHKCTIKEFLNT